LPLGIVVDIVGLLPDSAVFNVRRGAWRKWCKIGTALYCGTSNDCNRSQKIR